MKINNIILKFTINIYLVGILFACTVSSKNAQAPGVIYVASRGDPRASNIVWSPEDSTKILVSAIELVRHNTQVYILDIETKKKTVLIDTGSGVIGEGWSPNGKQITLSVDGAMERFSQGGLWIINTDDNSLELISNKSGAVIWLPDGNTLALLTLEITSGQNPRRLSIYMIDIQTKESKMIYSNPKAIPSGFSASPDGKYLVFSLASGVSNGINDLYILDIKTGIVRQLTDDGSSSGPKWSPYGDVIAYVKSNKAENKTTHSLYLTNPDGRCNVEAPNIEYVFSITWSPDGRKIAFLGEDGIYILDTNIVFGRDIYQNLCK
jgi:Tol biopolymer transport system component